MVKKLVTTSIESDTYEDFKKCIGKKKINQVLAEYMESIVEERKKVEALNNPIPILGASTMLTSNYNNGQQTILSYLNRIQLEEFDKFDDDGVKTAQKHYLAGSVRLATIKRKRRL